MLKKVPVIAATMALASIGMTEPNYMHSEGVPR